MTSAQFVNAAIVGLGRWGQQHVSSVQSSAHLRYVRAVSKDANEPHVRNFASKHGLPLTTEFADALEDDDVQAVVLCTPHVLHPQQIMAAARAGKHVYCEKPLALSRAEAVDAIAACETAGVVLAVGHDRRLSPGYIEFRKAVHSGEIGPILSVESNGNLDSIDMSPNSWKTQGGNAISLGFVNYGVHRVDMLVDLFGRVSRVHASRFSGRVRGKPAADTMAVLLEFTQGILGYIGTVSHSVAFSRLQAFGPEGTLSLNGWNSVERLLRGLEPACQTFDPVDTVRANVELFAKAIQEGGGFHITQEQMLHTAEIMEACFTSLSTRSPVDISDA